MIPQKRDMDESEWDLTMRLELARHNSQNQSLRRPVEPAWDRPVEDTIYEGCYYLFDVSCIILNMPIDNIPESLRPSSRASGSGLSQRSTTPINMFLPTPLMEVNKHPESAAPQKASGSRHYLFDVSCIILNMPIDNIPESLRPSSRASGSVLSPRSTTPINMFLPTALTEVNEHPESAPPREVSGSRPRGPRSPSPLPPSPRASPGPDFETLDSALETTLHNLNCPPVTPPKSVSPLPRSRRQPFEPTGNTEAAPRINPHSVQKTPGAIEPLSIKKKNSLRNSAGESPSRKAHLRTPPSIRGRVVSPRRVSPIVRQKKTAASSGSHEDVDLPKLVRLVESIKDEVGSPSESFLRH
jgi:hypothetical protein